MCQYLREIQTVGMHHNLIRSGNITRSVNFCGKIQKYSVTGNVEKLIRC